MKKYKLTNQNLQTYEGCQWELGFKKTTSGEGGLCNAGWLHYYHSPLLAVLFNPIHADIVNPRLFEIKAEGKHLDDNGLKGGCTEMTLVKELKLPEVTLTQKIAFGILCVKEIVEDVAWNLWADKWLSGEDRSKDAADAAYAAYAGAAAYAAYAAGAAYAARAAVRAAVRAAAYAAARAAARAADAAWAAAAAEKKLDLKKIAKKAITY